MMMENKKRRTLIIGGVAGGATAAARLRRRDNDREIIVFEKGEYISYANCGLPYYVGGVIKDRNALLLMNLGRADPDHPLSELRQCAGSGRPASSGTSESGELPADRYG